MLSDDIRTRLALLHRPIVSAPLPFPALAAPPIARASEHNRRQAAEELFAQAEQCENASGKHLRFCRPLAEHWPAVEQHLGQDADSAAPWPAEPAHPELAAVADHFPRGTLFLDLETCGFAGSCVFLVGLIRHCEGTLVVDQLFARNYAEERAVLETLWQAAAANRVLVTFNGKSFDWPMVHDRSTRHHLGRDTRSQTSAAAGSPPGEGQLLGRHDPRPQLTHCDLLHHARRRWKRVLPNCKLQTLERFVCKRHRHDDLGGALVPAAYHEFVRNGDPRPIGAILHHNALDLVTLVQVTLRLLRT